MMVITFDGIIYTPMSKWRAKKLKFVDITPEVLDTAAQLVDENATIAVYAAGSGYKYATRFRFTKPHDRDWLFHHFGGYKADQHLESGEVIYWLNLQQHRCKNFLLTLKSRIVVKKEQVKVMEEFIALVEGNRKRRLTPEVIAERDEVMGRLKLLTRKFLKERAAEYSVPESHKQPLRTEDCPSEAR
jgi:hypothetical protein